MVISFNTHFFNNHTNFCTYSLQLKIKNWIDSLDYKKYCSFNRMFNYQELIWQAFHVSNYHYFNTKKFYKTNWIKQTLQFKIHYEYRLAFISKKRNKTKQNKTLDDVIFPVFFCILYTIFLYTVYEKLLNENTKIFQDISLYPKSN